MTEEDEEFNRIEREASLRKEAVVAAIAAPVQKPVAWGVFEGGNLHDMFFTKEEADNMAYLKGSHAEVKPLTTPPAAQRTERNFCERCGKRLLKGFHIHTCTPPKENT